MKLRQPIINEEDFQQNINAAIARGRHVEYLREVIKKYDEYKKAFDKIITDKNPANAIYAFRVRYLNQDNVWRDIELLGKQMFSDLADEIIGSMGWDNDHMHGFELIAYRSEKDPLITGSSQAFFADGWEDDPHPTFKTNDIRICQLDYSKQPKLELTFDDGDGHRFEVVYRARRARRKQDTSPGFPKLIDQRGVAPEQYPPLAEE